MTQTFVGIDIGGTKLHGLLVDDSGSVLRRVTVPTLASEGSDAVVARIYALVECLIPEAGIAAIGLGAPGPLDYRTGTIIRTENLPFRNFPLAGLVERRFKVPTLLENDGSAAAFGEYAFGPAKGADPLLYLTASTGIGAGLVIGGALYRGKTGNALEAGHIPLMAGQGPVCACGGRGCAEALASGSAIAARAMEAAEAARSGKGEPTALAALSDPGAKEAFSLAEEGDAVAERIISQALRYLGYCAVTLVTLFDPEVLVIGGGLVKAGDRVRASVQAAIEANPTASAGACKAIAPGLGDDSGALGAAALAAKSFFGVDFVQLA
jgi:glucokinase